MAKTTPLKLVTLVFLILLCFSDGLKITTRLIHRDSIFSPQFNASLTTTDLAKRMVGASLTRHSASILLWSSDDDEVDGITPGLLWGKDKIHVVFYVNFSIGTPPVPQLAVLDTGSSMLWVRCPPCTPHCYSGSRAAYFFQSDSKTYSLVPCTKECTKCSPGRWPWSQGKECTYVIQYATSQSIGVYGTDQLTFRTNNDDTRNTTLTNVLFGCSQMETGRNDVEPSANGVIGLGNRVAPGTPKDHGPLVNMLGGKFSYCVGSTSNRSYPHNSLSFGDAANFLGKSTPLIHTVDGYYFMNINNISIGGNQMLNIDSDAFNHGTMIDSGSELTLLRPSAIDAVMAEVKLEAELLNLQEVRSPARELELCYRGTVEKDGNSFNNFSFHLDRGAELTVDNFGMFAQVADDIFCLAIMRSKTFNVVGMLAQQGYNVGYFMAGATNLLFFQKKDCKLLDF